MKIREMMETCYKQHGNCENCPLNVVYDWQEQLTTWCLISLKQKYAEEYKKYLDEGNEVLAERVALRYEELEREYLKDKKI